MLLLCYLLAFLPFALDMVFSFPGLNVAIGDGDADASRDTGERLIIL